MLTRSLCILVVFCCMRPVLLGLIPDCPPDKFLFKTEDSTTRAALKTEDSTTRAALMPCMPCNTDCHKSGTTEVYEVIIPPDLNLVDTTNSIMEDLQSGNEQGITDTYGAVGIAVEISLGVAEIITGIFQSKATIAALDKISQQLDEIAKSIDELTLQLQLDEIYALYIPDRQDIRFQVGKLIDYFKADPVDYPEKLEEFLADYIQHGADSHISFMYNKAATILEKVSSTTNCFRRIVAEFGKDIIMHVSAGVTAYYAYNSYKCLETDSILTEWNAKLIELQNIVYDNETTCINDATKEIVKSYMYQVPESGCPFGNNLEKATSTFQALTDRYDWRRWSVTANLICHGAGHSDDEQAYDGPKLIDAGSTNYNVLAMYIDKNSPDLTQTDTIDSAFVDVHLPSHCSNFYDHLRAVGVVGAMTCAEPQMVPENVRDNANLGYHGVVSSDGYNVIITALYG